MADDSRSEIDERPNYVRPAPHVHAGATDLHLPAGEPIDWYLPGWGERLQLMGWRVVFFLPAVLLACWALFQVWYNAWQFLWWLAYWKLILILVALPTGMAVKAAAGAIRARSDPFCIHCGYTLLGLPDGHRCPECGRPFDLKVIEEYKRDPHWFIERHKRREAIPQRDAPFDAGAVRRQSRDGT